VANDFTCKCGLHIAKTERQEEATKEQMKGNRETDV